MMCVKGTEQCIPYVDDTAILTVTKEILNIRPRDNESL
jgi:hypothetical protein